MKLNNAPAYQVEDTNPSISRVAVTVHNVAHTMRMLAETTYSRPIDAVVRETVANAVDACRNQKPIKIVCPSLLDPNFRVRDYGVGMSRDFFINAYSALGFSTKSASNEEIGGFGQGRFAAFAYKGCDVFYVRSVKDGRWFLGSVQRDANFNVEIDIQAEGDSIEPNGTEIIVPVLTADHSAFKQSIATYTEFLDPKPDCSVEPNSTSVELEGDRWRVTGIGYSYSSRRERRVIMGGIPYDLCISQALDWGNAIIPAAKNIYGVDFFFDIGELSVANSREGLRYDDETKRKIKMRIQDMLADLEKMADERRKQLKSDWETWSDPTYVKIQTALDREPNRTIPTSGRSVKLAHSLGRAIETRGMSNVRDKIKVTSKLRLHLFLADIKMWRTRYYNYIKDIDQSSKDEHHVVAVVCDKTDIGSLFGNAPYIAISTLPEPPKLPRDKTATPGVKRDKREPKLFKFSPYGNPIPTAADYTGHKIYIPMGLTRIAEEYGNAAAQLSSDRFFQFVGVPEADLKLAESLGWTRFDDYFRELLAVGDTRSLFNIWNEIKNQIRYTHTAIYKASQLSIDKKFIVPPTLNIAYLVFNQLSRISNMITDFRAMEALGFTSTHENWQATVWKAFEERHPLLSEYLISGGSNTDIAIRLL